jgi:hypothetical protein
VPARVGDRDRRPVGQRHQRLLVGIVERLRTLLVGQIQVPERLAPDANRHTEEALHRRMPDRKAVGVRMLADRGQPQRLRIVDQHAQHATPARQIPDRLLRRLIDAGRQEALELLPTLVEDPQRRIARPGQLARPIEHPVEHQLQIEILDQAAPQLQQSCEAPLPQARGHAPRLGIRARRPARPGLAEASTAPAAGNGFSPLAGLA